MLHVHRAERTVLLASGLADLLARPLTDSFAQEVVAVPAKGVERWLAQRLSTVLGAGQAADGICSGITFTSIGRLIDDALAAVRGVDPREDAWASPVWPLLQTIDACTEEPWCAVLAEHLGHGTDDHRRGRRWACAAHLAGLFRSYAAHRPHMLKAWVDGQDTDGHQPLPEDLLWQAELWRRLRERLGPSPAEQLDEHCARLRAEPELLDLPERISVFGPTRLPADGLMVLDALAQGRDVHLWLPHPSPTLWKELQGFRADRRAADTTTTAARHPLLRSLGRDVHELQLRLPTHVDQHHLDRDRPATLLGTLQRDLRDDRLSTGVAVDETLQVHACHGPTRQVEVLREVLLRLFEDDPTLEPRDVLVMCPDVEAFAPLISSVFGLGPDLPHPGNRLRVRLADRSLRQTNPLLDTVAVLLDLAGGRMTASQVLDLAATPGVQRMFGFDDEDLERLRDWVARAGVRWGLDADGRRPYALEGFPQNTWEAGLDRILLGVTTDETEPVWLGRALPLDDVDSGDIDLAGRFAELVDRLGAVLRDLSDEHPVANWISTLLAALDDLTATGHGDSWQLVQARAALADAAPDGESPVRLADVRALLADALQGRPTRANFRTGNLTVCTLVPMRSVPHRVIVLLGLDDGAFPRSPGIDGDDVLARDPCVGERDPRSEDRQLLLDAVVAAEERLVVLYTGADPVSGTERPPAVPVGELLDTVEVMTAVSRANVVARHPLQPYDARSFTGSPPFSFDPVNLAGAVRAGQPREAVPPRVPLPARTGPVALQDLIAFLEHPAKAYLKQRLGITLPGEDDELQDGLSTGLNGLDEWAVGERLLAAQLKGLSPSDAERAEWLRGALPPGALGGQALGKVFARVAPLVAAATPLMAVPPRAVDVRLDVGGREVRGTVNGVRGRRVVSVGYSTLAAKHRLRAWVLTLALGASGEGDGAVTVGRNRDTARTSTLTAPADAASVLEQLTELYDEGLCAPLPLATKTSAAYADARLGGNTPEQALLSAEREWTSDFGGDRDDKHYEYVWGEGAPLQALLAEPGREADRGTGEPTRFGALACRLWAPLRAAEQMS